MNILCCLKQVPSSALTPRIGVSGVDVEEAGLSFEANEPDLYALEEAIHQRSLRPERGRVTAVTVGPARARDVLHLAYAKGADHAVHVLDEARRGTAVSVRAVAEVARRQNFDLIFTGIQADDDLQGSFGFALAEALELPVISAVTEVEVDASGKFARVLRELGNGYKAQLEIDLPCVLTIQYGIRALRYTPVMAIVKARSRSLEVLDAETLSQTADVTSAGVRVISLSLPQTSGRCEMLAGLPAEVARSLVARFAQQGVL